MNNDIHTWGYYLPNLSSDWLIGAVWHVLVPFSLLTYLVGQWLELLWWIVVKYCKRFRQTYSTYGQMVMFSLFSLWYFKLFHKKECCKHSFSRRGMEFTQFSHSFSLQFYVTVTMHQFEITLINDLSITLLANAQVLDVNISELTKIITTIKRKQCVRCLLVRCRVQFSFRVTIRQFEIGAHSSASKLLIYLCSHSAGD